MRVATMGNELLVGPSRQHGQKIIRPFIKDNGEKELKNSSHLGLLCSKDERECLFQSHSLSFPMVHSYSNSQSQFSLALFKLFPFPSHSRWLFPFPPAPILVLLIVSHQITNDR